MKGESGPFPAYKTASVADLIPYARNSRTHSDAQVAKIAASIREFGFLNPIIVDGANGIVAGHGRVMAAQKLGLSVVPVIEAGHLTEAQKRAYVLADNRLALDAGWDLEMLRVELTDLKAMDFDLSLTGFEIGEIGKLMLDPNGGLTDPDDIPPPPAEPVSVLGDVWQLGRHRIACGSSTDADTVAAVLAGVKPHLMVTDPPYGVEYDAQWRTDAGVNKRGQNVATGKVSNDDQADWREAWALFPGDVAYVWHGALHAALVAESLASAGFAVRSQIIWAKQSLVIGRGHYHWQHEPCWYVVRKNGTGHWSGDRKQSTLWQIANMHRTQGNVDDGKTVHSTQKPVECMKRPIENNSSPGQAVYEPFSGSGTTIIAGEMTGRAVHAIELNPAYVDVAVKRWQDFTGLIATLEGDGRTFAEIQAERASDRAA